MEKKKVLKLNLPMEMVEEILINLPVKSLLRFSSVSITWRSIIWKSWFVKRYRRRAALPGRERIALQSVITLILGLEKSLTTYNVSSISSSTLSTTGTGHVVCDFYDTVVLASCNELLLAGISYSDSQEIETPLFLWNPSMRTHKKIPYPSAIPPHERSFNFYLYSFAYGLGYDSVGDDYKILRIEKKNRSRNAELYSLSSDSWREIPNFSRGINPREGEGGVFVSGNLHWLPCEDRLIVSFDLSTEKCGEVNYPPRPSPTMEMEEKEDLSIGVLRGMLCLYVNVNTKCVVWMMEEYGVTRSWNIKFTIKYNSHDSISNIRPLYLYENGVVLVYAWLWDMPRGVFIHQDEKTGLQPLSYGSNVEVHGILFVDSLVAPAIWSALI